MRPEIFEKCWPLTMAQRLVSALRALGFLLCAMKANGRTETYAFEETDDSLSMGFSLQGGAWGRGTDTLGIDYSLNVWKNTLLTAHDQRLLRPAYNADRRKANFHVVRFHAEF
ncbi:MAG: hypothetical protein PHI64_22390 [Zoogloea sp.]|uniref:hypothetical protein n=1 Tax=Zoogloea sp. TaxID=49181 RepID=UPI002608412C|nr:hypothetical protein [Zoogloea sp.]MDD2991690.1 hypothetical protein [Zoogloea sp.]